jgi:hypothetical protein
MVTDRKSVHQGEPPMCKFAEARQKAFGLMPSESIFELETLD